MTDDTLADLRAAYRNHAEWGTVPQLLAHVAAQATEISSLRQQLRTAELRELRAYEAVPVDEVGQYAEDCP